MSWNREKYRLRKALRKRAYWLVRDYDNLKAEYEKILEQSSPPPDGQPRGTRSGDPTQRSAIALAPVSQKIDAIEKALEEIPEEYRSGVFLHIKDGAPFPDDASSDTYRNWTDAYLFHVAIRMA